MNASAITKTLQKLQAFANENKNYSLGFCRWFVLPARVRLAMSVAFYMEFKTVVGESEYSKKFLESLTEEEFINYMKLS